MTSDPTTRLMELASEIEASPQLKALSQINLLKHSLAIFRGNSRDLLTLIDEHADLEKNFELFTLGRMFQLDEMQLELSRSVHNFAAGAMTLVDHARRLLRPHIEVFPDYQERVASEFSRDPLHRFIQDLRHYSVHYEAPSLTSEIRIDKQSFARSRVVLTQSELSGFSDWSMLSRRFIEQHPEGIDVGDLVREYVKKVEDFWEWVRKRLEAIYLDDIRQINAKKEALRLQYYREGAAHLLSIGLNTCREHPDDILAMVLTLDDFEEVSKIANPLERCATAINIINASGSIPNELISALLIAFADSVKKAFRDRAGGIVSPTVPLPDRKVDK